MTLRLIFTPEAEEDLVNLFEYVALEAGEEAATRLTQRLAAVCAGFAEAPHRGTMRNDLGTGVRSYGWRRRATIVFCVRRDSLVILGIFYGGRDLATLAERDFDD